MAGSSVWGVDREAIEQWGNTMCVLFVVLCGVVVGPIFSWGIFFPAGSLWRLGWAWAMQMNADRWHTQKIQTVTQKRPTMQDRPAFGRMSDV